MFPWRRLYREGLGSAAKQCLWGVPPVNLLSYYFMYHYVPQAFVHADADRFHKQTDGQVQW